MVYFGPRSNPVRDRYWAERGLIHHEDSETEKYQSMTVKTFLHRVKAIHDMLGNSVTKLEGFAHADEIERQQKFVAEAAELARRAQEQGEPPEVPSGIMRQRVAAWIDPSLVAGGIQF